MCFYSAAVVQCLFICPDRCVSSTDTLTDWLTDNYRQSEHMYKSGIMLIFYFSQRGLLAWQKGNKNYSIKQLSFHIQIWLQPHKAGCIILLSTSPMEYSYWKYPEREIILRSFLSLVYFLLFWKKKNHPCFPFLSWDNNYFSFADGDLTADYECSLTTEGISALISNNRIKLCSFEKKKMEKWKWGKKKKKNSIPGKVCLHCSVLVVVVSLGQAGWRENVMWVDWWWW